MGHPAPAGTPTSLTNGRTTLVVRSAGPMRGRVLTRGAATAASPSPARSPIYVHRTNGGTGVRLLRPVGSSPQIHSSTGHQYLAGSSSFVASSSATTAGGPRILRQTIGRGVVRGGPMGMTRGVYVAVSRRYSDSLHNLYDSTPTFYREAVPFDSCPARRPPRRFTTTSLRRLRLREALLDRAVVAFWCAAAERLWCAEDRKRRCATVFLRRTSPSRRPARSVKSARRRRCCHPKRKRRP